MNKNLKKLISTVAALAITATSALSAFAANFSDVADTADYKAAVDNLVALGIVNGYEDGTFGPEKLITRAEASKMIVGTMGPAMMEAAEASKGSSNFTDVAGDHWASGYIAQGVSKGYINGMGDGTFAPNDNVTYAQVVKMLVCVLGYAEDAEANGGWPNGYINQGTALKITDGVTAGADTAVNRGQVAMLINNALDTPINAITGYEPGFKLVDGQLVPSSVPVTEVYDGTGDSGKYETLLTTYFDAYSVRGRITDTANKAEGEIEFTVEWSENFDGDAYNTNKDNKGDTTDATVLYPAGLDVDSLLCTYSDAIIMENEDDDWVLISITPYGKNNIYELDSDLYCADADKTDWAKGDLAFYKSNESSRTDSYDLSDSVVVYVNGVKVADGLAEAKTALVDVYLGEDLPVSQIKLVDTPEAGKKTVDNKIDYIMVTSYVTAVVDEVFVEDDEATIYLEDASVSDLAYIKLDLQAVEDEEADYTFVDGEGNDFNFEELEAYDVLTIYAPTKTPKDLQDGTLKFLNVTVTKDVVSGKITRYDEDDKVYEVNGEEYSFAGDNKALNLGDNYTFYLNAFGKIAYAEKTASDVNYGIINRVGNSNGDYVVRLVNADGAIVTYEFNKKSEYDTWKAAYDSLSASADLEQVYGDWIVTYKLNANDKIYSVEKVGYSNFKVVEDTEYTEKSQKVGAAKMSDLTKVVDFSDAVTAWKGVSLNSTVAPGTVSSFADGEKYTVIYGGDKFTDGTYPFVVVTAGVANIGTATRFAVVKSTGDAMNEDGITYFSATVLEGKETKTIYFDETVNDVKKGAVIVYSLNGEGLVEADNYNVLKAAPTADDVNVAKLAANTKVITDWNSSMPWDKDKYGDGDKQAQLGFGVLIEKGTTDITVGIIETVDGKKVTKTFDDYDMAADANIYVYDLGVGKGDKMSVGAMANLAPTKLPSRYAEDDVYQWEAAGITEVKTVFFKMYEDEITDIVVIVPAE